MTHKPRIISCFMLFNEIDILRLRLKYDCDFIDRFVIVEGAKTFSGKTKPLYFEKYRHLFNHYLDKIEYHIVPDLPAVIPFKYVGNDDRIANEYRWHLEEYTRNTIKIALTKLQLHDSDLILISDIDEIVNKNTLLSTISKVKAGELHHFYLNDYRGSIAKPPVNTKWIGPYCANYSHIKRSNLNMLRTYHHLSRFVRLKQSIKAYLKKQARNLLENDSINHNIPNWQEARKILSRQISSSIDKIGDITLLGTLPSKAGIKKIVRHYDAGWHFSFMNGGLSELNDFKVNSFSHSEYSSNNVTDVSADFYINLQNFMFENKKLDLYDFEYIDGKALEFIKDNVNEYCILFQPKFFNNNLG